MKMKRIILSILICVFTFLPLLAIGGQGWNVGSPEDIRQYILTPPAPETPRVNGAKIFGVRPGSEFLYTIPVTGVRPMTFEVKNLPKGLKLDISTGRITGKIKRPGTYSVTLVATNRLGTSEREFRIVVGDKIALTPPMGWSSWNCWGHDVS